MIRAIQLACGLIFFPMFSSITIAGENDFIVRDINVKGLERISAGTIFNYLPIKIDEKFTDREGQSAIRALYKTGFFSNVLLSRSGDVLVITVKERP